MDLDKLEQLAKKATKGPWRVGCWLPNEALAANQVVATLENGNPYVVLEGNANFRADADANAAFVAAANPEAVLELVSEIKRLTSCLHSANQELERYEREYYLQLDKSAALEGQLERASAQIKTLQDNPNSYQSGYNRGRHQMYSQRIDELRQLEGDLEEARERIRLFEIINGGRASDLVAELIHLRQQVTKEQPPQSAPTGQMHARIKARLQSESGQHE